MNTIVLLVVYLTGCTGGDGDGDGDGAIAITLLSPSDGDTVCGDPLSIEADVENFTLTNETIEDAPPNVGHMHVYLNGQEAAQSDKETVEITGVEDGLWQLRLDLALANHAPLDPYVGTDPIYITVDNGLCTE